MASGGQQSAKDPDQDRGTEWKRSDNDIEYSEDSGKIPTQVFTRSNLGQQHFRKSIDNIAGIEHDMSTSRISKLRHVHSDLEYEELRNCPRHDHPIDEDLEPEEREYEQRQRQRHKLNSESSDHGKSTGYRLGGGQVPYQLAQSLPDLSGESGAFRDRGRGGSYQGNFRGRGHSNNFRGRGHPDNFRGKGQSENYRGRGHPDSVHGRGNHDNFRGRGQPDFFRGREHPDNVQGRGNHDSFRGRGHPDNFRGRGQPDFFRGRGHPDNVQGRGKHDSFRGRGQPDNFRGRGQSDFFRGRGHPDSYRGGQPPGNFRGREHDSNYRGRGHDNNYRGRGQDSHFRGRGHPGNFRGRGHEGNILNRRGHATRPSHDSGGTENETVNMSDEDNIGSSEDEDPKHKDIQQEDLIQWYDNQIEQKDGKAHDEIIYSRTQPNKTMPTEKNKIHQTDKQSKQMVRNVLDEVEKESENSQAEQEDKENNSKKSESKVDRKRRRKKPKRTESESEDFLKGKVAKQESVLLYIRIQQHIEPNYDVKAFLQARMESGKEFRFKVLKLEHVNGQTVITLEFQSKNQASSAANLLKLSNRGSQMKLVCTFIRAEAMDQAAAKDEEELKKQLTAITKRADRALTNHEEKIKLTDMKIKSLSTNKHVSLDEFEKKRIEKEALNDKLTEFQKQKDQFTSFLKSLVKKLTEVWQDNTYTKHLTDLRREFGVECCRLENALPMYARRNDIIRTVKDHQVSVILGETGSGKSTQMTQYLHQAGFSQNGIIVCTQPRKVAAISLATYVASEMATNVGNVVGYKVGMKAKLGGATKILYMTDHCLLNECLKDPSLSAYSCVIVDEAHERSIYTDLLLGMLKTCLKQRPELKAIITSATIDPDVFVIYFGGPQVCPVLKVSGRMFPVEVIYEPDEDGGQTFDKYIDAAVTKAVTVHKDEVPGDVLVFVTTPLETERCSEMVKNRLQGRTDYKCLILHGQVQPEEQQLVFQASPPGMRKIVFATNSAETSITIPGIKYVIDTGLVKEKRYDPRRNMSSLNVVVISRSSADQRKGRAGRTGPGRCYRLYSEQLYKDMEAVAQPEILKVHLGQAMLKLVELGINPLQYDFVQSPGQSAIATAMETLEELGAVKDNKITDDGRELAKLPLEPRLGLLIQKGRAEGAFFDAIVLAAVSSMGSSIFYRGGSDEDKKKADKLKVQFCHSGGDSLTLLNIYRQWIVQPEKQKTKWCFNNSINSKTIKGAREAINEITTVLKKESKVTVKHELQDPKTVDEKLQKILFDCYVSNICHYLGHAKAGYYAARLDQQVHAHPSTVLNPLDIKSEWLVFEQSLKTSKDFITGLTPVDEPWVVQAVESGRLKRNLEDMRNKRLVPVHTEHVGSQIFWKIVGPCFTKLRTYEANASDLVKPALAVIEASRDKGELKIFSSDHHSTEKLSQLFQPLVDTVKESLLADDLEFPLSQKNENAGTRVVLGPGGAVRDILMPDEYRTIFVEKPDENSSEDTILFKFSQLGKIKDHRVFKNPRGRWGCITFESAEEAKRAVQATKDDQAEVAVPERQGRGYQNSEFKVKIFWCRRNSRGFGFADVAPEEMPKILRHSSMLIKGNLVTVSLDRKAEKSLYLKNLGPDIMEEDIKTAILNLLGYDQDDASIIDRVTVVREKVEMEDLDKIRTQLQESIKDYAPEKRFRLDVLEPRPGTVTFRAFATFTNADEGIATCQGLSRKMYVGNKVVTMEPEIRSSMYINKDVYAAVKDDLDAYLDMFQTLGFSEVTVQSKMLKNGTIVLNIDASNTLELAKVRANLQEIVQGDVLECGMSPNLRHLFTRAGRDFLKDAEKKYSAFIQIDNRNLTISIRGKQDACSRVRIALNDYLRDFVEGEWREVSLRGRDKPNGLMKMLMNEYGLELEKLQQEAGLRSVVLNFKQQIVKMSGPSENIDKATSAIGNICSKLQEGSKAQPPEEELPDCCVCFCPVEAKDLYRMEYCGHAYCLDCVKRQVECALKDKELPLLCGKDGCGKTFMWRDITNLSRQGSCTMSTLASASVSSFVIANTKNFKYCLTPNCGMVYRVTSTGAVFRCPECSMKICTSCHTQYHEGLTCAMYLSAKEDDGNLDIFLANAENTKKCPNCKTPIEKIEGCNNMHCQACKSCFCWVCLAFFKSSQACYAHLQAKHGGFM